MRKIITGILCAGLTLGLASAAFAGATVSEGKAGGKMAPVVKKAVEACGGKAVGETCSFTGRKENTINGVCKQKGKRALICHPGKFEKGAKAIKASKTQ